jgi:hypothetical protein
MPPEFAYFYRLWDSRARLREGDEHGANVYFIYNETRKLGAAGFLEDRAVMLKMSFLFNL